MTSTTTTPRARIATFLCTQLGNDECLRDGGGIDMFATGLATSLFALQLVQFVEREFRIAVDGDDLMMDNFRSLDALEAFVNRKSAA